MSLSSVSWKITHKSGLRFYISLRTGVAFMGKKMSANQNAHTTFFTCEKNRTTNQNAQISHVKNIECGKIWILF